MNIIEINCETGEEIVREATQAELNDIQVRKEKFESETLAKESARQALLAKLGITAEEAQLLLGGN